MLTHHKKDRRRLWAGGAMTGALIFTSMALGGAGLAQTAPGSPALAAREDEAATNQRLLDALHERRALLVRKAGEGADTREGIKFIDELIQKQQSRTSDQERHRVIILEGKEGEAPPTGERRQFRIRRGPDGSVTTEGLDAEMSARLQRCESEQGVLNVDTGEGKERTRILVCTKDGAGPADRLRVLEGVRARISGQGDLSAETKARILAEIDRAIAAARGN